MLVYGVITLIIIQRLIEVAIAKKNERWMKAQGGLEAGSEHYPWMVALHVAFFISLIIEVTVKSVSFNGLTIAALFFVAAAQMIRIWALTSLGSYWNTKIIILPDAPVVEKGPYRYLRHPNYAVVIIEIAFIPLLFQAYWTAGLFTLLNAWMLAVRIPAEEQALDTGTKTYSKQFKDKKKFWFV